MRTGLIVGSALGCGVAGGAFFAFSTFIMRALARLPAPQGIAAMQSINVVVITPLFMMALFGTGAACARRRGVFHGRAVGWLDRVVKVRDRVRPSCLMPATAGETSTSARAAPRSP